MGIGSWFTNIDLKKKKVLRYIWETHGKIGPFTQSSDDGDKLELNIFSYSFALYYSHH